MVVNDEFPRSCTFVHRRAPSFAMPKSEVFRVDPMVIER